MVLLRRKISSAFLLSVGIATNFLCSMTMNTHAFEEKMTPMQKKTKVVRDNKLDHWDSDTLAHYLDNYPGYDLAVMFYANWDQNSRALAPHWNDIAFNMDAGSTQSKLIMALFDCELNDAHIRLCQAADIRAYPTFMFIGAGTFHDKDPFSRLLFGKKKGGVGQGPLPNTVKFQGQMYPESIKDWIKTMQALSRWHVWTTEGFGKRLRTFFLPGKKKNGQLPIGVPGGSSSSGTSNSGSSATSTNGAGSTGGGYSDGNAELLQQEVEIYKKATEDMTRVATRAGTMMELMLFGKNAADMFTLLDEKKAWDKKTYTDLDDIYRACVLETAVDYCQRLAEPLGTKVVDELLAKGLSNDELMKASDNMEKLIMDELSKEEPYCAILDSCISTSMKDKKCRPKTCPFNNDIACRMLASCKDPAVVKEYGEALKLDVDALLPQAA